MNKEAERLQQDNWKNWGPYLSDRQWGTVREDYSKYGEAWEYFSHDQARSRAYRWGEDGILGISDSQQRLCFAIALWNGKDPILKERLFGLTGNQGNHGEDVKEYYFYLESSPTHSYMKGLYKYPHNEYPYSLLESENSNRGRQDPEFELLDTHIFEEDKYYDIFIEYAKNTPDDILIKITICNRSQENKILHLLPTLWFRNTWSWFKDAAKPQIKVGKNNQSSLLHTIIETHHPELGNYYFYCQEKPELLFTDNETNYQRIFGYDDGNKYVKDGINNHVVNPEKDVVNPEKIGTNFSPHYILNIGARETKVIKLRLCNN